jgi:hypothetical protein
MIRVVVARRCLPILLSLLLAACGGGGGGSETAPPTSEGGNATPTGLVPAAAPLGAVLHTDASGLLPLRDGTVARFRGLHVAPGTMASYSNTVQLKADTDGFRVTASNGFDEGASTGAPIVLEAGAFKQRESLTLLDSLPPEQIELTLLRSPVRTGDRYLALDRRIANIGIDVDGDAVNDGLDVAAWSDVIGADTVTLGIGRSIAAVRVDTKIRMRLRLTVDRTETAYVESVLSQWYAVGLGLVKTRYQPPSDNGVADIVEEVLETLDAVDAGIGHSEPALQTDPKTGSRLPVPYEALAVDGHAIAIASLPGEPESLGFSVTRINARGQVLATASYRYADVAARGGYGVSPRLFQMGNELRVIFASDDGLQLLRLDATGQSLLAPRAVVLTRSTRYATDGGLQFQAGVTGDRLWLSWVDYPVYTEGTYRSTLWLQEFDAAGTPVGAAQALAEGFNPLSMKGPHAAGTTGDRLLFSWTLSAFNVTTGFYALTGMDSRAPLAQGMLPPAPEASACSAGLLRPLGPTGTLPAFWCWGYGQSGSATLDASMRPTQSGELLRVDPLLPAQAYPIQGAPLVAAAGGRLVVSGLRTARLWPEDSGDSIFLQFGELPWSASGAADTGAYATLARVSGLTFTPITLLPLGDRVLVIGTDCYCQGGQLSTMLVWR